MKACENETTWHPFIDHFYIDIKSCQWFTSAEINSKIDRKEKKVPMATVETFDDQPLSRTSRCY